MPEIKPITLLSEQVQPVMHGISHPQPGSDWFDLALTSTILAIAVIYLYHRLWRQGGRCNACGQARDGRCPGARAVSPRVDGP